MSAIRVVFAVKILALSTLFQHPRMTGSENADLEKEISSASLEVKGL